MTHYQTMQVLRMGIVLLASLLISSCVIGPRDPDMGGLYNDLAQSEDPYRNPVILIPGTMGSRLVDQDTEEVIWGVFGPSNSPKSPAYARQIALPMARGKNLAALRDSVVPNGALDRVKFSVIGLDVERKAYFYLLSTLSIAGYRDGRLGILNAIDYGEFHYTCFQYDHDWRRDLVDSARRLHEFILAKRVYIQQQTEKKYGIVDLDVRFDIVAHSMGGLVATPNAGSTNALINRANGFEFGPFLPRYDSTLIGTHPSAYRRGGLRQSTNRQTESEGTTSRRRTSLA